MAAYYNEIEPFAAEWLRNLIAAGHIAPGDVDTRSILDVKPDDLRGYTQCHFFAGIGGWSYALRLAGWPDARPVWTGSCPCQPFSAAGAQRGSNDERHLWPAFFNLIRECRPAIVFGEQVAGAAGYAWFDHVAADLEGEAYAAAAVDIGAHSVGAPHLRQRLYWVANADPAGLGLERRSGLLDGERQALWHDADGRFADDGMADADHQQRTQLSDRKRKRQEPGLADRGSSGGMVDAVRFGLQGAVDVSGGQQASEPEPGHKSSLLDPWFSIEWLQCSDGKARPTQPGLFPLSNGLQSHMATVRSIEAQAMMEIERYGSQHEADAAEIMRMVRQSVCAEAPEFWEAGGRWSFHPAPVLLNFLLDVEAARYRAADSSGWTKESAEAHERTMQCLRDNCRDVRTPYRRESEEQRGGKFAGSVRELSLVLARHAEAHGQATIDANAASSRVGILRGAGNAIVPQVASAFVMAAEAAQEAQT
jgi:DNA (cytosine-5)-methyltransferase 1